MTTDHSAEKQIRPSGNDLKPYAKEDLIQGPNSTFLIKHFAETLMAKQMKLYLKPHPQSDATHAGLTLGAK